MVATSVGFIGAATLESTLFASERELFSFVTVELNLAALTAAVSTYYLVAASCAANGFATLERTLLASERVAISDVTAALNLAVV